MSVTLHHIARYAAQKLASGPRAKEKATNAARVVVGEANPFRTARVPKQLSALLIRQGLNFR